MAYISFKPKDHFNTKLYTGNATDDTAITGVGFTPSFLWGKNRTDAGTNHFLIDAVRGVTKELNTNNTSAEGTDATLIKSFDSDGFTLGDGSLNQSSKNFVTWNWKANGSGSSNTDGTITSTVSANTTAGFSIIKYNGNGSAGATIGHGLGVAPKCVIIKRTDTTSNWIFGTGATGFTKFLYLNLTDAETTNSGTFNNTAPSTSVITLGSWNDVNNSSGTYIAYCFAEKKGFSKFGSYTGNGNADGTFVYTGFKPAFVLQKRSSATESWQITDHARDANVSPNFARLMPNSTNAESTNTTWAKIEKFSNGFKLGGTDTVSNSSGSTYIYMAFAEEPLVASNGIPATAR